MVILSDENCYGHAVTILHSLERMGLRDLLDIHLVPFEQVGLPKGSKDEDVWLFCQRNGYILLTGNRSAKDGEDSLEMVTRRFISDTVLPVVTIGDINRVRPDPEYCDRCAESLADIVWGIQMLQHHLGTPRLYIPFG